MTRLKYASIRSSYGKNRWSCPRSLVIRLRPWFDGDDVAQHIDVEMVFEVPGLVEDDSLFRHSLVIGTTPTTQYDVEDIEITTESGHRVGLYSIDDPIYTDTRLFRVSSDLHATSLKVNYRAQPRKDVGSHGCGPQVALEKDGGGLSASGEGFLLELATPGAARDHDIKIQWAPADAPTDTRAVCSFGEGDKIQFVDKPTKLQQSFFMVGKVSSYPRNTTGLSRGFYWLTRPDFDPVILGKQLDSLISRLQAFFKDPEPLFRVFCRYHEYKCTSAMGLHQGFVFGWNSIFSKESDGNLEFIIHELVHNWPRLETRDRSGIPTPEENADGWFNEGIAEYYSLVLPHRMGLESREEFIHRLNVFIPGYYTNPSRAVKNREFIEKPWNGYHWVRIPYQRGMMFFLKLACQLHAAGKRSLDDLIYIMVKLRRTGQSYSIKVWLALVAAELGPSVYDDYNRMSDAELIRLPADCMRVFLGKRAHGLVLSRQDQEEFYLGFPESCLSPANRVVSDLDLASRAAQAGICEGDVLTEQETYMFDAEKWDKTYYVKVKRGNSYLDLRWWPRNYEKVESYQIHESPGM